MMTLFAALLATTAPTPDLVCTTGLSLIGYHGMEGAIARMGPSGLELVADYARDEPACVHAALRFGASGVEGTAFLLAAASDALDKNPETILTTITEGHIDAARVCRFGGRDKNADRTPTGMQRALRTQRKAVDAVTTAELQSARKQCLDALDIEIAKLSKKPKAKQN